MPIQTVELETADGPHPAFLHMPAGEGPWPGVFLHVDEPDGAPRAQEIAERLASSGYAVLTPEPATNAAQPFVWSSPAALQSQGGAWLGQLYNAAMIGVGLLNNVLDPSTGEVPFLHLKDGKATVHGAGDQTARLQEALVEAGVELRVDP